MRSLVHAILLGSLFSLATPPAQAETIDLPCAKEGEAPATTIRLDLQVARLLPDFERANADTWIDDVHVGKVPLDLKVPVCATRIRFQYENYAYAGRLRLKKGTSHGTGPRLTAVSNPEEVVVTADSPLFIDAHQSMDTIGGLIGSKSGGTRISGGLGSPPEKKTETATSCPEVPKAVVTLDGKILLMGALPPNTAEQVLTAALPDITQCYQIALAKNSCLQGKHTLKLTVQSDGKVASVKRKDETLDGDGVTEFGVCIDTLAKELEFPEFTGSGISMLQQNLRFENQ